MGEWEAVRIKGAWNDEVKSSFDANDNAELPFEGTGFRLMGSRGPDHGIAEIWIDGALAMAVDLYSPQIELGKVVAERRDLPAGHHVLDVRVTGRKNAASSGTRVVVDGAEVYFR
jgi:hypothetical protein